MHTLLDAADPAVPTAEQCVLGPVLRARARQHPDRLYALFDDGGRWTYAATLEAAERAATGLRELGLGHGDPLLVWLPNGPDILRCWFGANLLGAVYTPVNTAYRGALLEHVIGLSGARVLVVHAELLPRLAGLDLGRLEHLVVVGEPAGDDGGYPGPAGPRHHTAELLVRSRAGDLDEVAVAPWDTQSMVFTSGTTGPSKGVLSSYVHLYSTAGADVHGYHGPDDRYLVNLPLFHGAGMIASYCMMLHGGSVAVVHGFETGTFLPLVRRMGVTVCTLLGAMAGFLAGRPEEPDEADNPLRTICLVPSVPEGALLQKRYRVDTVYTTYNMTEICAPLISGPHSGLPGFCGRARPGVELRLVDEHDREVPVGETGELVVRAARPWALSHGYAGMPEATARAWRNGWFHTGDCFRATEDGDYFFVDRAKDAIRRRGENISSFEVENAVLEHPDVAEAAAVGVPSRHGEEDVLVAVVPAPGAELDPAGLLEFLRPRTAHFMVPRYVRTVARLPYTPSNKVRKHLLREAGVTGDTWDREAAGVRVGRTRFGRQPDR
ncbi:AMP-binding protein [Streptomyces sp. TRM 70361]|uniref:AMP-binding protein n=1 Tax=Streptomyces sp. TRM 70361 TaxID=3116553 RepID=UPI002E7AC3E1|nr:AMP-binding protein [Streptomyces sp. TRM 70361]MEE1942783.1 AMP-binding protein [Streptomyces sp. TRM 70361]